MYPLPRQETEAKEVGEAAAVSPGWCTRQPSRLERPEGLAILPGAQTELGGCGGPAGGGRAWEGCKLVWGGRAFLSLPVAPAFVLMCH